jgi:CelD/BcsL family acetyltransferase involved in cellulose biosynthesis
MRVTVVPANQLSPEHATAWSAMQRGDLDSPFLHVGFTQAVAAVRDVEVAIVEQDGAPAAFLPFERRGAGAGQPVGQRVSDFQGLVCRPDFRPNWSQLLSACRLSSWHFDHLLAAQAEQSADVWAMHESPYIDVRGDLDTYLAERLAAGGGDTAQAVNKRRRAERKLGPARFEWHTRDRGVLASMIEWKTRHYEAMQVPNPLSWSWTLALLDRFLEAPDEAEFGGLMSALYFGDRLAAVHLGLRARHVVHWWFTTYDAELAKYSPGAQMLLELVRTGPEHGITRIDLGKGQEAYKRAFMTGSTQVAEGCIAARSSAAAVHRMWHRTKRWVKESALHRPARSSWRMLCRVRDQILSH